MSFGLGSKQRATPPVSLPLGNATWAPGGWWDLTLLTAPDGTPITTPIPSVVGSNVLTPANQPTVNPVALWGNPGAQFVDTQLQDTEQYLSCDVLASYLAGIGSQSFVIGMGFGQTKQTNMPLWNAGNSTPGPLSDSLSARSTTERVGIERITPGGGTENALGAEIIGYDYHNILWCFDKAAGLFSQWIDGVPDPLTGTLGHSALTVNIFTICASRASVTYEGATGNVQWFAFAPDLVIDDADAETINAYRVAQNYTVGLPTAKQIAWLGDSITRGGTAQITQAGFRFGAEQATIDHRLSIESVGPDILGIMPNRKLSAQASQPIAGIILQASDLVTAGAAPDIASCLMGNGDVNAGNTAAAVLATYAAGLETIYNTLHAVNAQIALPVSTLAAYLEPSFNAVVIDFNAGLPAVWAAFEATHPLVLFTYDANAALGGPARVSANFETGGDHPNQTGYDLWVPALLAARRADGRTLLEHMIAISPT